AAKRKFNDYLCAFEELEVEAGFAPLDFPVFNVLTGKFLPIANSSETEVFSPLLPCTSAEVNKP
ncbi:unnamed protein product, partial [Schistosoma curassoni]